jgi:hypothetical protein
MNRNRLVLAGERDLPAVLGENDGKDNALGQGFDLDTWETLLRLVGGKKAIAGVNA